MPRPSNVSGHLALIFVQFCFGLFPLFGKLAFEAFDPRAVAGWRVVVGAAVLATLALWLHGREALPRLRDLPRLQLCALLGVALNQVFFLEGLERAPTVDTGLIVALIPTLTFAIAIVARHEKLQWIRAIGIVLGLFGTLVLMGPAQHASDGVFEGQLILCGSALCYSLYLVISRPLAVSYPPLAMIAWIFVLCLWTVPFLSGGADWAPAAAGREAWLSLLWIVTFPTVLAYLLSYRALSVLPSSVIGAYAFSQPLIIGVTGILFLGEELTTRTLLAAPLILGGLALVIRPANRPSSTSGRSSKLVK